MGAKEFAKEWLPPGLTRMLLPILGRTIRYSGHYRKFSDAASACSGYDADEILRVVAAATADVLAGKAPAERDGVLLDSKLVPYPVVAELMYLAARNGGELSVCDFGGSLGSLYRACSDYVDALASVRWGIVEQAHYVAYGQANLANDRLRFFASISDCQQDISPSCIVLSSVLQYMEEPLDLLKQLNEGTWQSIILDRTPFVSAEKSFVTVQYVPAAWVKSSYPSWLFAKAEVMDALHAFRLIAEFPALDGRVGYGDKLADFRGLIFRRHEEA